jgi:lipoic acid synthetase
MRLPDWIKTRSSDLHSVKKILRHHGLSTVCEEARCPNKGICFSKPTATFMILGDVCSRNCGFCSVKKGIPNNIDPDEPEKIAEAAASMELRYVVITSVTRDDLPDGGSSQFAKSIYALRRKMPDIKIEVLTPDFKGDVKALKKIIDASPDVFNHNMETVKRLYHLVRPQADYYRSLDVLSNIKAMAPHIKTKSGFMLGLGEKKEEILELLKDLRDRECDFLTIGQYLRPSKKNLPVVEYINPEVFDELKDTALKMGFKFVASGPLVRSSMNAEDIYKGG